MRVCAAHVACECEMAPVILMCLNTWPHDGTALEGPLGNGDLLEAISHWRWLWSFEVWMSVPTSCLVSTSWKYK